MSLSVACSLSPDALKDRLGWIGALNRELLRAYTLERAALRLVYRAEAAQKVREFVEKEGECCGFLHFAIHEAGDEIVLRIDAPDLAGMNAEPLFAPFMSGAT